MTEKESFGGDDKEFEESPEWLEGTESTIHRIQVFKGNPQNGAEKKTVWIQVIENDEFENGSIAMDITDRVERDMTGQEYKYKQ